MNTLRSVTILAGLAACGGAQPPTTTTGGGAGSAGAPAAAGDVSIEVPVIEVKGLVFEPEALGRPGMPLVEAKKKTTIEKQRAVFASTKEPVQKQAHAAILATMLYQKSKDDKAKEKALWTEARQALRDATAAAGASVEEITLRLLGSYELLLEDYAGAEKAWSAVVATVIADDAAKVSKKGAKKAEPSKDLPYYRAWWAYALLRQFKNGEALEIVKNEVLSDKQPELAYAAAWAKWRTNDDAGAWTAMVTAVKGGAELGAKEALERDLFLFAGRTNVSLAEARGPMEQLFNAKQKAQQYEVLAKLGFQAYQYAGRWADGVAALDLAVSLAGDTVPVNDLPVLRYSQADFTVRLDNPEAAAKYAKQAIDAMPGCGTKCTEQEKQDLIYGVYGMGRLFHVLYATANDVRYYQPAHDLYLASVEKTMDAERRAQTQKDMAILEATLKNTKVGTGTHDQGAVAAILGRHNQEVQACYEAVLSGSPKLAGALTLMLESDQSGEIKGATTSPAPGLTELAAVAGCVTERAQTWKLPKRGMAGSTRVKLSYVLSARAK